MKKIFKCCLPVILFCTISILACKKPTLETNVLSNEVLSPPAPDCSGTCNISSVPDDPHHILGQPLWWYTGELGTELAAYGGNPFTFTYDANNNPATCAGYTPGTDFWLYYNSTFNYTNGRLTSIFVDNTYTGYVHPDYSFLANMHTGKRIDLAYSNKVVNAGGYIAIFPVINVTLYKSDTVPLGEHFRFWTATGCTYYYEYGLLDYSHNQLKVKRYKANALAVTQETRYTYDSVGHLTKVRKFRSGIEESRITIYGYDTKNNFASGNKVMQLLTSTYGKNNSKLWQVQSFDANPDTYYGSATYVYNLNCYPVLATVNYNGQPLPGPTITYTCY